MRIGLFMAITTLMGAVAAAAIAGDTPSKPGTKLYFLAPQDGETITGKVRVVMGLDGMGVAPALVEWPNTGHHHILINRDLGDPTVALDKDDQTVHLGGGQTETTLDLPPGTHTLQLVLGDHGHVPHNPPVLSEKITITVK